MIYGSPYEQYFDLICLCFCSRIWIKYCLLCARPIVSNKLRHFNRQHPQIAEKVKKGKISAYLKEDETPPYPIYSNWKEMIYSLESVSGIEDTRWTTSKNQYKPGALAGIAKDQVKAELGNFKLREILRGSCQFNEPEHEVIKGPGQNRRSGKKQMVKRSGASSH